MPDPIDLAPFAERVNGAVAEGCPMLIATANEGQPDLSLRGSLMVWDQDHLAFWERALLESYAGLLGNPKIAAFYRSPARKEPYLRFYGEARLVEDPAQREEIWGRVIESEKKSDPEKKGVAFLIRVDRVRQGRDVIQQRG